MRKLYVGLTILTLLLVATLCHVRYLNDRMDGLAARVDAAAEKAQEDRFEEAAAILQEAIDEWNAMDGYTHIFIRHAEIDGATDAFYEYLSDLCAADGGSARGSYEKLRAHLGSIATMERVSVGSVF